MDANNVTLFGCATLTIYLFVIYFYSSIFWCFLRKGNRILRYGCRRFDTFWVPDDIESCNFQNLLVFGFPETSQNLMSFRQLLFSLFHGGTKGKNLKTPEICQKGTEAIKPGLTMIRPFFWFVKDCFDTNMTKKNVVKTIFQLIRAY